MTLFEKMGAVALLSVLLLVLPPNDIIGGDFVSIKTDSSYSQSQSSDGKILTIEVKGVTFRMIYVQGGTFQMGATPEQGTDAYDNEKPVHRVTLSGYWIGETAVTQALWDAVMENDVDSNLFPLTSVFPVTSVCWEECRIFIQKLSALTNKNFRMPTEAEWEYAARGGNISKGYKYSGSDDFDSVGWCKDNIGDFDYETDNTLRIKSKIPNELGLYGMSGTVSEWCQDWYGDYSSESQTDPKGPATGEYRVCRGGDHSHSVRMCRVSFRSGDAPDFRDSDFGLRLAM